MSMIHRSTPIRMDTANVIVNMENNGTARANLRFRTTENTMDSLSSVGSGVSTFDGASGTQYKWLVGSALKNWDIYLQPTSGSLTSGTVNTWLQLGAAERVFSVSSGATTKTCTLRLRVRSNSTLQEVTSANVQVTLTATDIGTTTDTK